MQRPHARLVPAMDYISTNWCWWLKSFSFKVQTPTNTPTDARELQIQLVHLATQRRIKVILNVQSQTQYAYNVRLRTAAQRSVAAERRSALVQAVQRERSAAESLRCGPSLLGRPRRRDGDSYRSCVAPPSLWPTGTPFLLSRKACRPTCPDIGSVTSKPRNTFRRCCESCSGQRCTPSPGESLWCLAAS